MNPFFAFGTWRMRRRFRRALLRELRSHGVANRGAIWRCIAADYRRLVEANADRAKDQAAHIHLSLSAQVLAAYQNLEAAIPERSVRLDLLTRAFGYAYRSTHAPTSVALILRFSKDPTWTLLRIFGSRRLLDWIYGNTFDFEVDARTTGFTLGVNRCFYNDFFRANGAAEVTPVFCAADDLWSRLIDPTIHRVHFQRPSTLARGSTACRFEFERQEPRDA